MGVLTSEWNLAAQADEWAKKVTDPRFLNDMEKSGFWDQIWAKR